MLPAPASAGSCGGQIRSWLLAGISGSECFGYGDPRAQYESIFGRLLKLPALG